MRCNKLFVVSFFCVIFLFHNSYCTVVGSNTTSSRQFRTFFPASHTDNTMMGFSVFENGLTLEDATTNCSFDAFFPISGDIVLNGGVLSLAGDIVFKAPLKIGPGKITSSCSCRTIEFPANISSFDLPSVNHYRVLSLVDQVDIGERVNAIDWSYDDKYLAVASNGQDGGCELQIYYFHSLSLTLTASADFDTKNVHSVKWHPSDYYLAVGKSGDDELKTFYFNDTTGELTEKDSKDVGTVYALSWHPTGTCLAVGRNNNNTLLVYDVQDGIFGNSYSCPLYTSTYEVEVDVQRHGLDWYATGTYLAVGIALSDVADNWSALKVFTFDGTSLSENSSIEFSVNGCPVSWMPNRFCIAVGLYSGEERFRVYTYDPGGSLIEKICARIDETKKINDVKFSSSGTLIAEITNNSSTSHELRLLCPDCDGQSLNLMTGFKADETLKSVSLSHDENYIATGGVDGNLYLLQFTTKPIIFNNVKLFFNSDVVFGSQVIFEGNCTVNGAGNIFEFGEGGSILIDDGSSLVMEDMKIKNISADKIGCADEDGVIVLRDVVWVQDNNYTFSVGALQFKNDVLMSGDYVFAYQSKKTSTLLSKSNLELDLGFTFSYDPVNVVSQNLVEMEDSTSTLILNGATLHTTGTGIQLTKGKLRVLRDSFLSSENDGVTLGNGNSSEDIQCDIFSGVTLWVTQGSIDYRNVLASSWNMHNLTSILYIEEDTQLNLYENLNLGEGSIVFGNNTTLGKALDKELTGEVIQTGVFSTVSI